MEYVYGLCCSDLQLFELMSATVSQVYINIHCLWIFVSSTAVCPVWGTLQKSLFP
jgi:hypothetical protein